MARSLGESLQFAVLPVLDATAVKRITARVDEMTRSRDINVQLNGAKLNADLKKAQLEIAKITGDKSVTVKAKMDLASAKLAAAELKSVTDESAGNSGKSFASRFNAALKGGNGSAGLMSPQVIAPIAAVGLSLLPGLFAAGGAAAAIAFGGAFAVKGSPELQRQLKSVMKQATDTVTKAAAPLVAPIHNAFVSISGQLPKIGNLLHGTFSAVSGDVQPFVNSLLTFTKNVLPGFNSLMRAAAPAVNAISDGFGRIIGTSIGKFFQNLTPGVKASSSIFNSLFKIAGALLPPLGSLASILAVALAPVFKVIAAVLVPVLGAFGKLVKACMPLVNLFAVLAGAMAPVIGALTKVALTVITGLVIPALNKLNPYIQKLTDWLSVHLVPIINKDVIPAIQSFADWLNDHLFPALVNVVKWVGAHWKEIALTILGGALTVIKAAHTMADGVLDAFGLIINGAAKLFGWVPGIGGKLKGAASAFNNFRAGTDAVFNKITGSIQGMMNKLTASEGTSKSATAVVAGDFAKQQSAAGKAFGAVANYTNAIRANGANSDASHKSRSVLVNDMIAAGVNAHTANSDVANYTSAVKNNGINSDAARAARLRLNADIEKAFDNSQQGKKDMNNLTAAVLNHSSKSDAVRSARARLIADLENAGLNAKDAKKKVDDMQSSINKMKGKNVNVNVSLSGSGGIKALETGGGAARALNLAGIADATHRRAKGGPIPGFAPGVDNIPALLSPGEFVINPVSAKKIGLANLHALNKFATGGPVGLQFPKAPGFAESQGAAFTARQGAAFAQAALSVFKQEIAASGPPGGGTGAPSANAREGYAYLLANVFHGNRIAAAGAVASIYGESGWNPFAQGTGGRGLIGWTPPGTISNADFAGGMRTQLPAIIKFLNRNNDWGRIAQVERATSVLGAANLWGRLIERFGINDVHPFGVRLATQIMQGFANGGMVAPVFDRGGTLAPGYNLVNNATGKPEHLTPDGSGKPPVIELRVTGGDSEVTQFIGQFVRRFVRVNAGGDVARALGRK